MPDNPLTGDSPAQQPYLQAMADIQGELLGKLGATHSYQDYLNAVKKVDWGAQVAKKLNQPAPPPMPQNGQLSGGILGQIGTMERGKVMAKSRLPTYSTSQPQVPSPYQNNAPSPAQNQLNVSGYSTLPSYGRNPFYQQSQATGFTYY